MSEWKKVTIIRETKTVKNITRRNINHDACPHGGVGSASDDITDHNVVSMFPHYLLIQFWPPICSASSHVNT